MKLIKIAIFVGTGHATSGYRVVAFSKTVDLREKNKGKISKSKKSNVQFPPTPIHINECHPSIVEASRISQQIRILKRVTFIADQTFHLSQLNNSAIKNNWDLVAVQAMTEAVFMASCNSINLDIITFDTTEKRNYKIKRTWMNLAKSQNIHIEFNYFNALNSSPRRILFGECSELIYIGRDKSIIISSGCRKEIHLRSPHDIKNLCLTLGFSPNKTKDVNSVRCLSVLSHAEARKIGKSTISYKKIDSLDISDEWKIKSLIKEEELNLWDLKNTTSLHKLFNEPEVKLGSTPHQESAEVGYKKSDVIESKSLENIEKTEVIEDTAKISVSLDQNDKGVIERKETCPESLSNYTENIIDTSKANEGSTQTLTDLSKDIIEGVKATTKNSSFAHMDIDVIKEIDAFNSVQDDIKVIQELQKRPASKRIKRK